MMKREAKEKILLVDDDRFILSGVSRVLEKEGFDVTTSDSGEDAVSRMKEQTFDLVLTDLVMGQVGGVEVLRESKEVQPEAMVIILTGYADMKAAVNAIKFGADDFMIKPAEPEEIYFRVRKCLENKVLKRKVKDHTIELEKVNEQLRLDIIERTRTEEELGRTNKELKTSLQKLQFAQDRLIQREKMAALGGLVAGVTHEINTPVGIGITASSFIRQQAGKIIADLTDRSALSDTTGHLVQTIQESAEMISSSLARAGELISSFKQVSVDQESEKQRAVIVDVYLEEILTSLHLEFRKNPHRVELNCPEGIVFNSRPGALAQIITNFVVNAMRHAFDEYDNGLVAIDVTVSDGMMLLKCTDNGRGMPVDIVEHIYEPFFTTKRESGGSGLGMYVVYNLVTNSLNGSIDCESEPGKGTCFSICVPLNNWE